MRNVFLGMLFILLSGCSLFTSEDLDNDTAKDAATSFLEATFTGDDELVESLALFNEDKQADFIDQADGESLADTEMDACVFNETDDLIYETICENGDGDDVYITMTLDEEDDENYFIKTASMKPAVAFTFRQDASELTDDYVQDMEDMINMEFPDLDDEEKQDMKFKVYHFADALKQFFDGDEDVMDYINIDRFATIEDSFNNERELIHFLKKDLSDVSGDPDVTEIEVGSFYDNLEDFEIRSEDDFYSTEDIFPFELEEMRQISYKLDDDDGDSTYFVGPFYMDGDEMMLGGYVVRSSAAFGNVTYDIDPDEATGGVADDVPGETPDMLEDAEELYLNNCAACHGDDLAGGAGPELTEVYDNYTEEELVDIMVNGKGNMPGMLVDEEEAQTIGEWLLDME